MRTEIEIRKRLQRLTEELPKAQMPEESDFLDDKIKELKWVLREKR